MSADSANYIDFAQPGINPNASRHDGQTSTHSTTRPGWEGVQHSTLLHVVVSVCCGAVAGLVVSLSVSLAGVSSPVITRVEMVNNPANSAPGNSPFPDQGISSKGCPARYVRYSFSSRHACYKFKAYPLNALEAQSYCRNEGAELLYLDDIQEYKVIIRHIHADAELQNPSIRGYWLGVVRRESTYEWEWMHNGDNFTLTVPWAPGQPSHSYGDHRYAFLNKDSAYQLDDTVNEANVDSICKTLG